MATSSSRVRRHRCVRRRDAPRRTVLRLRVGGEDEATFHDHCDAPAELAMGASSSACVFAGVPRPPHPIRPQVPLSLRVPSTSRTRSSLRSLAPDRAGNRHPLDGSGAVALTARADMLSLGPGTAISFEYQEIGGSRHLGPAMTLDCAKYPLGVGSPIVSGLTKSGSWGPDTRTRPSTRHSLTIPRSFSLQAYGRSLGSQRSIKTYAPPPTTSNHFNHVSYVPYHRASPTVQHEERPRRAVSCVEVWRRRPDSNR